MQSVNPANGEVIEEFEAHGPAEVEARLTAAANSQRLWRRSGFASRAKVLRQTAEVLRGRETDLAQMMASEMGKPVAQGRAEVLKCAWVCEYYAEHAATQLADQVLPGPGIRNYVTHQPLGVVLAVMPWNFPLWQVFRCAAPALMAGNAVVLKHASNVPGSAVAFEELFASGGALEGLCSTLLIGSEAVAGVIADPRVAAVSLTGSTPAGRAVASTAGQHLKKCVLELGGSDPYVVLGDADPEFAAKVCVQGRMLNGGQSCIAAKRFVVVEDLVEPFTEAVVLRMRAYGLKNPLDELCQLGPMARLDLRDELHEQVRRSVAAGAELLLGGEVPREPQRAKGAWYPPTVLGGVRPGMPAFDEELFGPVAAVVPARDETEALQLANMSEFGLGACVLSGDVAKAERLAAQDLDAGACFVNGFVRSDPRLPFGGVKHSGYGRELAAHGIREFVNAKTVCVFEPG